MLSKTQIKNIEDAIKNKNVIEIIYVPNTNPSGTEYGLRRVIPLNLFKKNGKEYLFTYFLSGASLSKKGTGFRLYITNNIRSVLKTNVKNVNVKLSKNYNTILFKKILKNDID